MIRGLDASAVQGPLPYSKLDPEIRFAILKAQQGNDGFDPWFRPQHAGRSRQQAGPVRVLLRLPVAAPEPGQRHRWRHPRA